MLSTFREQSNNANGLLIDPQGRLVACEGAESQRAGVRVTFKPRITRTDLPTGKMDVLVNSYEGQAARVSKRCTIDGKGRLYLPIPRCRRSVDRMLRPGDAYPSAPDIQRPDRIQVAGRQQPSGLVERTMPTKERAFDPCVHTSPGSNCRQHAGARLLLSRTKRQWHEHRHARNLASAGINQLRRNIGDPRYKRASTSSRQRQAVKFIPIPGRLHHDNVSVVPT